MDSSSVLRQQSQNKICSDFLRMKNEHNKMPADPKPSKLVSAPHLSKQESENKDPGISEMGKKAPVRPGVSRLPVLAKSHRLQTPSDFSQSHCRWEEKPLAGKAKKKKPCTRPVPFNLSQPKSSRSTNENQQPLTVPQCQTGTDAAQPENGVCIARCKTQNINSKPTKHQAVLNSHVDSTHKSHRKATENISHLSGKSGLPNTFKTPATLSSPLSAIPNNTLQNSAPSSAQPALSAETCLENMNLLSLKDPTKTLHASQNTQQTSQVNFSKGSADKRENFQSDHSALLSILRNEGVSTTGLGSATPQSKLYNYLPQRVSVMKSRQKAGPTTVKLVQFSPDPAALQSILQNEGVTAGGLVGATPQRSVCPSGRGTSVYTAQRVPVRKNHAEATGGPAVALRETPLKKWTPQRVRDTRHQPMSAMKWHLSTQQSPYVSSPGLKSCKTNLQPQQEEVVQRLFDDQVDEQNTNVTDRDPETQAQQLAVQASITNTHCDELVETSRANTSKDEEQEQEQKIVGEQPFFQAPQRESVIFFSTGKKLFRAPRFKKEEISSDQNQHGTVLSEQRKVQPVHEEVSSVSQPTSQINPPIQGLHRDITVQKSCGLSPAVALLRKRLPPLEELRMDEEVATYTSVSVAAASGFHPPRPRCGNPLASILHFEESSRFVPIDFDLPSGPSSPQSSPLQER
ncbi:ras guanine nucleotide exchange factor R isoform X2 [Trachinotus anak]|uniref:ras guanine nucleotide exchange factor R isoform X2 n=1 Tax=Trachinotus anak TaxID=443729 RepID=UPI0039F1D53F